MNEKIKPDEFRKSMDRCLSGVKADPFLAGRVIASKEGEPRMKRKLSVSLVFVLVALLALGTVAYSATRLFKNVNMNGEVISTEPPTDMADSFQEAGINMKEVNDLMQKLIREEPNDDVIISVWCTSPTDNATTSSTRNRMKTFNDYGDFLEFVAGVDYLTLPAQLPEGYTSFTAKVYMECLWGNTPELIDRGEDGPVQFVRYTFDDSAAVITSYEMTFSYDDQEKDIMIAERLIGHPSEVYVLRDCDSAEPVTVNGMEKALRITIPGYIYPTQIVMLKSLHTNQYIHVNRPPEENSPDDGLYKKEEVCVYSKGSDSKELLKLFNAE